MLQSSSEFNNLGAGVGYGGGGLGAPGWGGGFGMGMGGFGLVGLVGLTDLFNRRKGGCGDDDCGGGPGRNELATLAAIANAKDQTVAEGRGVLAAIANAKDDARANTLGLAAAITNAKDQTIFEGRALGAAICELEKTDMQQFYAAAIQAANNTQAIKDQASAIAVVADKRFDDLAAAGVAQTAAILARINQTEIDELRDKLHHERRRGDSKEIEISIQNSAVAAQAQAQQQFQAQLLQKHDIDRKFDALFNQVAKASQDIINVGGLMTGSSQTSNPVNVK